MSGPADNTPGCPVCGLAWQAKGCTPEECGESLGWGVLSSSGVRRATAEDLARAAVQALRNMVDRAYPRIGGAERGRCIYCAAIGGPPQARHYPGCPVGPAGELLAEIDAVEKKTGGGGQ